MKRRHPLDIAIPLSLLIAAVGAALFVAGISGLAQLPLWLLIGPLLGGLGCAFAAMLAAVLTDAHPVDWDDDN